MRQVSEWVKIIDKDTNTIIAAGQIDKRKDCYYTETTRVAFNAIALDSKWFFNEDALTHFIIADNPEHLIIPIKEENIPVTYKKLAASQYIKDKTADVYREYGIDELDKEVEYLVNVLNKFANMKTVSSCCGHNISPLWVDIQFESLCDIGLICKLIFLKFSDSFKLTTHIGIINNYMDKPILKLITTSIGEEAYKKANEFAKELEKWKSVLH